MSKHFAVGLLSLLLSGPGSVQGQVPGPSNTFTQAPNQISTPTKEKGAAALERWRSCARRAHPDDGYPGSDFQALFKRPQNISEMLQNLKLAWENDWLLRPDFYDDETLLKFFNGATITWKQPDNDRFPAEEIAIETDSRAFPQMSIALEAHCRSRSFPQPNGREKTILSIGGYINMFGKPVPELTLATVRQALGPEIRNEIDPGFAGESGIPHPLTTKGSVVYTDPAIQKREGQKIGLTFYFSIPPKPVESFQNRIGPEDVVQGIVLSAARHRTTEN